MRTLIIITTVLLVGGSCIKKNNSNLLKRNTDVKYHTKKNVDFSNETGIFLTYGQSNSSNHGEIGYHVKNEVFQFFLGKTFIYKDPSLGCTGNGGSVWGMVGDKLIENGIYENVIFSNCGFGGKSIEKLKSGEQFDFLVSSYFSLVQKFGRVNGILFHQGESNNKKDGSGTMNYYRDFKEFTNNLKLKNIYVPIYLSRASMCKDLVSNEILIDIQNKLINDIDLVVEGPNTDFLSEKKYRLSDNCHFSMLGYEKFSEMWVSFLKN